MPTKGAVVYGTIYAPLGEVRTNGQSFTVNQGRVIALDFLQNGNGGGFSASIVDDPYAQPTYRSSSRARGGYARGYRPVKHASHLSIPERFGRRLEPPGMAGR